MTEYHVLDVYTCFLFPKQVLNVSRNGQQGVLQVQKFQNFGYFFQTPLPFSPPTTTTTTTTTTTIYIIYIFIYIYVFCFLNMLFWGFKKNSARFWRWANCPCCYYRDQQDNLANAKIEPISIWIFWNFFYWPISSYWSCSILCIVIKVYQSTLSMKKILGNTKRWKKMDQNLRFEVKITQNMSNVA